MNLEYVAAMELPKATLLALACAAAAWGGYAGATTGRVIQQQTGARGTAEALIDAARVPHHRTREFWLAIADFAMMVLVVALIAIVGLLRDNQVSESLLAAVTLIQGGVATIAYLTAHGIIRSGRPEGGLSLPGARTASRNVSGRQIVSLATAEKQPMDRKRTLTRQERARFIERGAKIYKVLQPKIAAREATGYIAISVNTERFTVTDDDSKLKAFAETLKSDDFLWMKRLG